MDGGASATQKRAAAKRNTPGQWTRQRTVGARTSHERKKSSGIALVKKSLRHRKPAQRRPGKDTPDQRPNKTLLV